MQPIAMKIMSYIHDTMSILKQKTKQKKNDTRCNFGHDGCQITLNIKDNLGL